MEFGEDVIQGNSKDEKMRSLIQRYKMLEEMNGILQLLNLVNEEITSKCKVLYIMQVVKVYIPSILNVKLSDGNGIYY